MYNIGTWELVIIGVMLIPAIVGLGLLLYFATRTRSSRHDDVEENR